MDDEIMYVIQKGREIRVMGRGRQLCLMRVYSDYDRLLGYTSKTFTIAKGRFTPYIYTYDAHGRQVGTPIQAPHSMRQKFKL